VDQTGVGTAGQAAGVTALPAERTGHQRPSDAIAMTWCLYTAVALAFSWPLPLHLTTHLTGSITGDIGVYVWNQWVFRHELAYASPLPIVQKGSPEPDAPSRPEPA
jgi:hypothetical protein